MKKKRLLTAIMIAGFTGLVQAKIIISDVGGQRDEILNYLKRISHQDLMMDHNGEVSYPTHWYDFFISSSYGRRLVCSLINSTHTIEIVPASLSTTHFSDCQGAAILSNSNGQLTRGSGSSSVIYINMNSTHQALVFNFGFFAPNTLRDETTSVEYILAHEMIHALHGAYGLGIPQYSTTFTHSGFVHVQNAWYGMGSLGYYSATEIIDMEEAVTVGFDNARTAADQDFPGYSNDPLTDITENAIRTELGEYLRGMYASREVLRIPESEFYTSVDWGELGQRVMDVSTIFCHGAGSSGNRRSLDLVKNKLLDSKDLSELSVYPSPAQNNLFLKGHDAIDKIEVYNNYGQPFDLNISDDRIDVSGLFPGVYIINFFTKSGKIKTKTFIKK